MACIIKRIAIVAIVGDSPVIVLDKNGEVIVSPEHNVRTNAAEREAAIARGGTYESNYICSPSGCGLQVSRALGDFEMGGIISREPEIFYAGLGPESIVLLCSDGVVDPAHANLKKEIEWLVTSAKRGVSASDLMTAVKHGGLRGNATLILWRANGQ